MVVFVDLDEDAADPAIARSVADAAAAAGPYRIHSSSARQPSELLTEQLTRLSCSGPPSASGCAPVSAASTHAATLFLQALNCYPVVLQIARHLDLNSLHDLSATCRQSRLNLLQYREQLIRSSLRCTNEQLKLGERLADRIRESHGVWAQHGEIQDQQGLHATPSKVRMTSGRVGQCARDMVGECRRCGLVVCRNCTIKSPSDSALSGRHRRLCRTCMKAPLSCHIAHAQDMVEPIAHRLALGGLSLPCGPATSSLPFTAEAFSRLPCTCPEAVYICCSCGTGLRSADTTYMRGWAWRSRYSSFAGYGVGIGEGNEGVECGRGADCLAAKEVEKEIDCDAEELADLKREKEKAERDGRRWGGTSYLAQQIEGIGGVMKTKVKKLVRVGNTVKEYEDEREHKGNYLGRELKGANRSWCCWCNRVIPSKKDLDGVLANGALPCADSQLYKPLTNSSSSSVASHIEDQHHCS